MISVKREGNASSLKISTTASEWKSQNIENLITYCSAKIKILWLPSSVELPRVRRSTDKPKECSQNLANNWKWSKPPESNNNRPTKTPLPWKVMKQYFMKKERLKIRS